MPDPIDLESLVHLEQTFYDAGYADGFAHGRIHGLIEGRALGRTQGFEIWSEIGFYQGFATMWAAAAQRRGDGDGGAAEDDSLRRALHHVHHLEDLVRRFPMVNPSAVVADSEMASGDEIEVDLVRLQRQIRSRYKALCASIGVRPILRAGDGDGREGVAEGLHF